MDSKMNLADADKEFLKLIAAKNIHRAVMVKNNKIYQYEEQNERKEHEHERIGDQAGNIRLIPVRNSARSTKSAKGTLSSQTSIFLIRILRIWESKPTYCTRKNTVWASRLTKWRRRCTPI